MLSFERRNFLYPVDSSSLLSVSNGLVHLSIDIRFSYNVSFLFKGKKPVCHMPQMTRT